MSHKEIPLLKEIVDFAIESLMFQCFKVGS